MTKARELMSLLEASQVLFGSLPPDLREWVYKVIESWGGKKRDLIMQTIDNTVFRIKMIPTARFPDKELYDGEDTDYAKAMIGASVPPVIMYGNTWIDGRHRVYAAKNSNQKMVAAIDLRQHFKMPGLERQGFGELLPPR
jgi:hypothetical protein